MQILSTFSVGGKFAYFHEKESIIKMNIKSLLFLFGIFSVAAVSANSPVITQTELIDLELVSRNTGDAGGVLPVIDRTITQVGHHAFVALLSNPITDIKTLQTRQELIKSLQKPELNAKIREQLLIIKQHEAILSSCFDKEARNKIAASLEKSYYQLGRLQGLNDSAIALDIMHIYELCSLFGPLIEHVIMHFVVDLLEEKINNSKISEEITGRPAGQPRHNHLPGAACVVCALQPKPESAQWMHHLFNAFKAGHLIFHLFNFKEMIDHLVYKADVIDVVHQEIISVNACIHACAVIGDILKNEPLAAANINADLLTMLCEHCTELVVGSIDPQFAANDNNNLGLFSRVGPTLAMYKGLGEQADLVNQIMQAAGAVDAMLGASTLLSEQAAQYSFAQYQEGTAPYIKLDGFIHPQLTGTDCIQNSFVLSKGANTDKLVITGPNAAGKSSITKAMVVNLVLAQTLGIVAAKNALLTPMHGIITYINIRDNLAGGASAFAAELIRTNNILSKLSALNGTAPTLALFDDSLFRTTQPIEGEIEAYKFIKKICNFDSTIALVVTHFEQLTKLETETRGLVRNYHIGLDKDAQGNIISTYHLHPGISPRDAIFSIVTSSTYQCKNCIEPS